MNNTPHDNLPPTWVWTRRGVNGVLYFARDTRWAPNVPDVGDMSEAAVCRYAWECNRAERTYGNTSS